MELKCGGYLNMVAGFDLLLAMLPAYTRLYLFSVTTLYEFMNVYLISFVRLPTEEAYQFTCHYRRQCPIPNRCCLSRLTRSS